MAGIVSDEYAPKNPGGVASTIVCGNCAGTQHWIDGRWHCPACASEAAYIRGGNVARRRMLEHVLSDMFGYAVEEATARGLTWLVVRSEIAEEVAALSAMLGRERQTTDLATEIRKIREQLERQETGT